MSVIVRRGELVRTQYRDLVKTHTPIGKNRGANTDRAETLDSISINIVEPGGAVIIRKGGDAG